MTTVKTGLGGRLGIFRRNRVLSQLYANMMDGFAYHKMVLDREGKPVDYVFLDVNEAFESITGLKREAILGKRATQALPGIENDPSGWIEVYGKVALTGKPVKFENYSKDLGKWFKVSAFCPQPGYFMATFEDITQRKEAEEALISTAGRLGLAYEAAKAGTWEWDLQTNRNIWSDELWKLYGVEPNSVDPSFDSWLESIHPDDRVKAAQAVRDAAQKGIEINIEWRVHNSGDSERWLMSRGKPIHDTQGQVVGYLGIVMDITELKLTEAKIRKVNRTLRALSNGSQALMRAIDEDTYSKEVCNILFHDCGYELVWVGLAQQDDAKTVSSIAYAGFDPSYIDSLRITWADTERGRGPTGTVIRTGKPYICRNMACDPNFMPWRKEAAKRGYSSSLVLPLTNQGQTFGALNIYSKAVDPFSDDEVTLLSELASDLSYGIVSLRLRLDNERTAIALRESEQRWSTTIASIGDAIITTDLSGKIVFMNPVAEELTGWHLQDAKQKPLTTVFRIIDERSREVIEDPIAKIREKGKFADLAVNSILIRKNGQEVPIDDSIATIRTEQGVALGIVLVFRDISKRKKTEEALSESEEKYRTLFNSISQGVSFYDSDGKRLEANPAASRILGIPKKNLENRSAINDPVTRAVGEDGHDLEPREFPIAIALKTGKPVKNSIVGVFNPIDESLHWIKVDATPLFRNGEAKPHRLYAVFDDITERKQMQDKLEEYAAHLEEIVQERTRQLKETERLTAIGETAGMVGHDLRNPLQTITGEVYLAKNELKTLHGSKTKTNLAESLQIIADQTSYMDKIVSDLQDFVKPFNPVKKPVDLKSLIDATIIEVEVPKSIKVNTLFAKGSREVLADDHLLKRVFFNLLTNAVQAMPNGGKLDIKTQLKRAKNKKDVLISFQDTGEGIPDEIKPKLFKPLFTTKPRGQGFGLPVCKRVIEAHGGTITFESKEGKGTKFVVDLPH